MRAVAGACRYLGGDRAGREYRRPQPAERPTNRLIIKYRSGVADSVSVTNNGSAATTVYVRVRYDSSGTGATVSTCTLNIN